ncbi:MAG: Peptidoglycan-binding domain 1 protein, partial [Solirubrobacterales bacterium]|nr:Peptidoglycan-binding domain 1 protein [Solirubrobacterales bacterium]
NAYQLVFASPPGVLSEDKRVAIQALGARCFERFAAAVGAVAQAGQDGGATIAVTVALPPHGVPRLDKAPVSVSIARQRLRRVSAVPVVALLARPGGGYGVELVEHGRRRLVRVTPGLFADGWVQVDGVRPGQRVAVPGA